MNSKGYELNCVCRGNGDVGTRPAPRAVANGLTRKIEQMYEPKKRKWWIPRGRNGIAAGAVVAMVGLSAPASAEPGLVKAVCRAAYGPTLLLQAFPFTGQATWGYWGQPHYVQSAPYSLNGPNISAIFEAPEVGAALGFTINTITGQGIAMGWWGDGQKNWMPITCRLVR